MGARKDLISDIEKTFEKIKIQICLIVINKQQIIGMKK
jgi:hypothetical protein